MLRRAPWTSIDIYGENTLILERDEMRVNPEYPEVRWFFDYIIHDRQNRRSMQIYDGSADGTIDPAV